MQRKAQQNNNANINKILQLTASLDQSNAVNKTLFLSMLLHTALDIIPESDYGFSFSYEGDYCVIADYSIS